MNIKEAIEKKKRELQEKNANGTTEEVPVQVEEVSTQTLRTKSKSG